MTDDLDNLTKRAPGAGEPKDRAPGADEWCARIDEALANERDWRAKAGEIVRIFRGETDAKGGSKRRFNVLFANTSILQPAVYGRAPQADVRRRFAAVNPLADAAADVLQKAANAAIEAEDLDGACRRAVQELLLPGRGVVRVRWQPVVGAVPVLDPATGAPALDAGGAPATEPRKLWEDVTFEHVYWEDFLHEPARAWTGVGWVAFRQAMGERALRRHFGEAADRILGDEDAKKALMSHEARSAERTELRDGLEGRAARALVWECWDRETGTVTFLAKDVRRVLLVEDDPLGLEGFFPCPEPMAAVTTTDQLVPVPEFSLYQDLADEIDQLTERIDAITKRLRVRGAFNGSIGELADIIGEEDGTMVPVEGGVMEDMGKAIWFMPLDMLTRTAVALYGAREQAKQALYEVTGISDILRGATHAGETATAQRIKGNFGTLRISDRRRAVERFARDLIRLAAEIMAKKFAPATLQAMTGEPVPPPLAAFLREEALLWCHVDVESDSTVAVDEAAEQEAAAKLFGTLSQALQGFGPLVQSGQMPLPLAVALVKLALKPFKGSRDVVEMLGEIGATGATARSGEGGPGEDGAPPDPKAAAEAMKARAEMAEVAQDAAITKAKGEVEMLKLENAARKALIERRMQDAKAGASHG